MFPYRIAHHGPGVLGWLFLAAFLAVVVIGVLAVVRLWRHPGGLGPMMHAGPPPRPGFDPALAELRLRYARGEITWDEFAQRSANLGFPLTAGPGPGGPPGAYAPWPQPAPPPHSGPPPHPGPPPASTPPPESS